MPQKDSADAAPTTETAIIKAACSLFARHGFQGVSMRSILREAGANVAAGHYYFRSKEALYQRCIEINITPISEERARNISALEQDAEPGEHLIEAALHGYIWPHLRHLSDPDYIDYLQMISRFPVEPRELTAPIIQKHVTDVRDRYIALLTRIAPALPQDATQRYFGWIVQLMCVGPFDVSFEVMSDRPALPKDPAKFCRRLVLAGAAAFRALAADPAELDAKGASRSSARSRN
jgi:AcrR family transcriptional regulator